MSEQTDIEASEFNNDEDNEVDESEFQAKHEQAFQALMEKGLTIPFDLRRFICSTYRIFSPLHDHENSGRLVKVHGGTFNRVDDETGDIVEEHNNGCIAVIVSGQYGLVLVHDFLREVFIGWLSPDEYESADARIVSVGDVSWMQ